MVLINEWLPNPKGQDAASEWVELKNESNAPVDLSGWRLTADGKKFYTLEGVIGPGSYVVLPRSATKVALRNTDGRLALYDALGQLNDQVSFLGSAPEGESANRTRGGIFFGAPTPGGANTTADMGSPAYSNIYPTGVPLGTMPPPTSQFLGPLIGTALALAGVIMFILKSHENLSDILFDRDQNTRRGHG